jgi:hypothetical protein
MLEIQGKAKTLKNITKTINIIKGSVKWKYQIIKK